MRIRNIHGTSENVCQCGSWLKHWENFSGQPIPRFCSESTCTEKDLVGAHVQKESANDRSWYIIPLCKKHNASVETMVVSDFTCYVPANVASTCG